MDEATEITLLLRRAGHDLHEPLVAIEGYLALLNEHGGLDADARELVDGARAGAAQMRRLLRDTLAYARAMTAEPRFERVDAAACAAEAAKRVGVDPKMGALPVVRADAEMLTGVLEAALSNARRFAKAEVSVEAIDGDIVVRDDGPGMDDAKLARLFKPFERMDAKAGSGLGLATARVLVERMGGKIRAESRPGEGCAVFVRLPRE